MKEGKADTTLTNPVAEYSTVLLFTLCVQSGFTPLILAAHTGKMDCIDYLVREGKMNVNAQKEAKFCFLPMPENVSVCLPLFFFPHSFSLSAR